MVQMEQLQLTILPAPSGARASGSVTVYFMLPQWQFASYVLGVGIVNEVKETESYGVNGAFGRDDMRRVEAEIF